MTKQRSYAGWFVAAVIVLLLLLAFQVLNSMRRDRSAARANRAAEADERKRGPAYVEDGERPASADDLGDLDDLDVTPGAASGARRPARGATGATSMTAEPGGAGTSGGPAEPGAQKRPGLGKLRDERKPRGER